MASHPDVVFDDTLRSVYRDAGFIESFFEGRTPDLPLYRAQTDKDFADKVFMMTPREKQDVFVFVKNGAKWIKGCLSVAGAGHKGISTFDKPVHVSDLHGIIYEIPGSSPLHDGLAVTNDGYRRKFDANHYTIAPKNDMPMALFMVILESLAASCKRVKER